MENFNFCAVEAFQSIPKRATSQFQKKDKKVKFKKKLFLKFSSSKYADAGLQIYW